MLRVTTHRRQQRAPGPPDSVGRRVFRARKQHGITQRQLGALVGLTYQAVSKIENDQWRPHRNTLLLLVEVLDLPLDQLMRLWERMA